jgi:phosphate transport system permease protein
MSARSKRARATQTAAAVLTGGATLLVVGIAVFFLGLIFVRGIGAISWEFLTTPPRMGMREGGIYPVIVGTLLLTVGTALFMLPMGIGAGVYLSEFASKGRSTRLIRLAIANMAGVPSIVYGLFGLAVFVMAAQFGASIIAGSLTLACLSLPVVITSTEEALQQVPSDLRHASLAVGASRIRTIGKVILPAAAPGIVTGSILALSRAAGETAPIIFTAAAFSLPQLPDSPSSKVMALPYHIYVLATQIPRRPDDIIWGTAFVLVFGIGIINVSAAAWRSARRKRIRW